MRWISPKLILPIFSALLAGYGVYTIFTNLGLSLVDQAGHLASANRFFEGFFHQFNDQSFLGSIHNLFYPPLEDALLGVLLFFFQNDKILGYQIYLGLVWCFFILSIFRLLSKTREDYLKHTLILVSSVLLLFQKKGLLYLQGLGLLDLTLTGLSAQFLGFIFFLNFIYEKSHLSRTWLLILLASLCILSHFLTGLTLALYLGLFAVFLKDKQSLKVAGFALGLTSFFTAPLFLSRTFLIQQNVMIEEDSFFSLAAFGSCFLFIKNKKALPLAIMGCIFTLTPLIALQFSEFDKILFKRMIPPFHYYRLTVIGIWLTLLSFVFSEPFKKKWEWALAVILLGGLAIKLPLEKPINLEPFQAKAFNFSNIPKENVDQDLGREWVIEADRSIGFGIESMLSLHQKNYRSLKGLYWESARPNLLLSSFLATLLSPPVILDYFFYSGFSCQTEINLAEQLFRHFNVTRITFSDAPFTRQVAYNHVECLKNYLIKNESKNFQFLAGETFQANGLNYQRYQIAVKLQAKITNAAVERISPQDLLERDPKVPLQEQFIRTLFKHSNENQVFTKLITSQSLAAQITGTEKITQAEPIRFIKSSQPGEYVIDGDPNRAALYWVKLAYLPGLMVVDSLGHEAPVIEAYPGFLVLGKGPLKVQYRKPISFLFGYGISILTLLAMLFYLIKSQKMGRYKVTL